MAKKTHLEKILDRTQKALVATYGQVKAAEIFARLLEHMDSIAALAIGAIAEKGHSGSRMAYRALETLIVYKLAKSPNEIVSTTASLKLFANMASAGLIAAGVPQLENVQFPQVKWTSKPLVLPSAQLGILKVE